MKRRKIESMNRKKMKQLKPTQIQNMLELTDIDIKMVIVTVAHRIQKLKKTKIFLELGKCF